MGVELETHQLCAQISCHSLVDDAGVPVVLYGCETWSLTLREEGARGSVVG
jgi:hypothetical protein